MKILKEMFSSIKLSISNLQAETDWQSRRIYELRKENQEIKLKIQK